MRCRCRLRNLYCARAKDPFGRIEHRAFLTAADRSEWLSHRRRNRLRHEAGLDFIPERVTFAEWAERWLSARKTTRPEATWRPEVARLERDWLPILGKRVLSEVRSPEIECVLDELVREGSSPATRNRHRAMLHRMFEEARKQFPPLVVANPVSSIPTLSECWKSRERVYLTERQLERYCRAAKLVSPRWYRIAEILCWSGIRISEALALRWIDFGDGCIFVRRIFDKTTGKIVQRTKSQRGKGGYRAVLLDRVRRLAPKNPNPNLVGGGMDYFEAYRFHRKTLRLAELPSVSIRILRHSCARAMKRRGLSRDQIRDALGHESAFTTERYTRTEDVEHVQRRAVDLGFGEKPPKRRSR